MKQMKRTPHVYKGRNVMLDVLEVKATSYNWWQFVKRVKGIVVFNSHRYSVTTARHQSEVLSMLRSRSHIKPDLFVDTRVSLSGAWLNSALENKYVDLYTNEMKMKRKGIRKETKDALVSSNADLRRDITLLRKLGAKCSKATQKIFQTTIAEHEATRLETQRAANNARKDARKALESEHGAKMRNLNAVEV